MLVGIAVLDVGAAAGVLVPQAVIPSVAVAIFVTLRIWSGSADHHRQITASCRSKGCGLPCGAECPSTTTVSVATLSPGRPRNRALIMRR